MKKAEILKAKENLINKCKDISEVYCVRLPKSQSFRCFVVEDNIPEDITYNVAVACGYRYNNGSQTLSVSGTGFCHRQDIEELLEIVLGKRINCKNF